MNQILWKTCLICLLHLLWSCSSCIAGHGQPNIVLILGDDQAWGDYGFMGHKVIQTPNLDKLAARSLVYERGYVAAPLCRPSLASIITGRQAFIHGIVGNDVDGMKDRAKRDLPLREAFHKHPSFIKLLVRHGYLAHQSGKWWEGSYKEGGFTHGMTHGVPSRGGRHGDEGLKIGRQGIRQITDFIDLATKQNHPFFIWYAPFLPHTPHNPPKRILQRYQQEQRSNDVAKYFAMCEWFDETCGNLLDYLEHKNLINDTLVLFLCDNGWAAKSTNSNDPAQKQWNSYALRSKGSPFENGIRTPILVSWPGKIKPKRTQNLAHAIDIFPTLMDAASLPKPSELKGISLIKEQNTQERKSVYGVCHSIHNQNIDDSHQSLQYLWTIQDQWKLILRFNGKDTTRYKNVHNWDKKPTRLYHILADPKEKNEISADNKTITEALKKKLMLWYKTNNI